MFWYVEKVVEPIELNYEQHNYLHSLTRGLYVPSQANLLLCKYAIALLYTRLVTHLSFTKQID